MTRKAAPALMLMALVISQLGIATGSPEKELNVLMLLPFEIQGSPPEQPSLTDGPFLLPAAELAVEEVNERPDLLPGYSLSLSVSNSACNLATTGVFNFVDSFFHSGKKFVGIVGPTCSDSAEVLSAIAGKSKISILNFHIASSPRLANRDVYGYTFGTVGSSHAYVGLFLHLMKINDWQSIAVLYEESKIFYLTAYSLLVDQLPRVFPQGRIAFSEPISKNNLPLSSITNHHLRVVLVLSHPDLARRMMCLINRVYPQLMFPAYQFVFMEVRNVDFHSPVQFSINNHPYSCSAEEITSVMEGFIFSHIRIDLADKSTELVSGKTYEKYFEEYGEKVNETTVWANPIYDGVWSLTLALNNSLPQLDQIGFDLSEYTYGHQDVTDIIRKEVLKLNFQGASGHISFGGNVGYTTASVDFNQLVDNASVLIGYYFEDMELVMTVKDGHFVQSAFELKELLVHPALAGVFLLFTLSALVLIIIAHVITLIYRNFSAIRASSYLLGQLAFIGCYIITVCSVSFTVQKVAPSEVVNTTSLCVIQVWCLPLGFTLVLGTVTAKTWRLYRIFVHLTKPGKLLSDWVLIVVVLLVASIDVVLCTIWTAAFQFNTLQHEVHTRDSKIEVRVECNSDGYYIWLMVLTIYQGLIMSTAFVLALLTKNIRHESFKTRAVIFLVYFLTITLALGYPIYLILNVSQVANKNAEYVVLSLTHVIVLYLCFGFLFFPPILALFREKMFPKVPQLRRFATPSFSDSYKPSSFISN